EIKEADAINYSVTLTNNKQETNKNEANSQEDNVNKIIVKFVVNSCGLFDSDRDVHVEGCWNKTAKDNKNVLHLREHKATFDNIRSDNVKLSGEEIEIKGVIQACLGATCNSEKKDSAFRFEKYRDGKVKEHSVG